MAAERGRRPVPRPLGAPASTGRLGPSASTGRLGPSASTGRLGAAGDIAAGTTAVAGLAGAAAVGARLGWHFRFGILGSYLVRKFIASGA